MSNRKKVKKHVQDEHSPLADSPPEPRSEDSGFSFPLGKNAQIGDAKFLCASPRCPGYPYRASQMPHPADTCGSILSASDAVKKEPEAEMTPIPDQTSPTNDLPTAQSDASELSPTAEKDTPSLEPDTHWDDEPVAIAAPTLEPDILVETPATEEIAPETPHDGVELPSPAADMLPRIITDPEQIDYFCQPHPQKVRMPKAGTYWTGSELGGSNPECYFVNGVNPSEGLAFCDYHCYGYSVECLVHLAHFGNGDLFPYLTRPKFIDSSKKNGASTVVLPRLDDPGSRGLRPSGPLCCWVPMHASWWYDRATHTYLQVTGVDEEPKMRAGILDIDVSIYSGPEERTQYEQRNLSVFLDGSLEYLGDTERMKSLGCWEGWIWQQFKRAGTNLTGASQEVPADDILATSWQLCSSIARELDVDPLHVQRLLNGYLDTFLSFLSSKSLTQSSPAVAAFVEQMRSKNLVSAILEALGSLNAGTGATVDDVESVSGNIDKIVAYLNEKIEPRLNILEGKLGTKNIPPAEEIEQMRQVLGEQSLQIAKDLQVLNQRMDDVEMDRIRRDKVLTERKRANATKKTPEQREAARPEVARARRRKERVWREKKAREREMQERVAAFGLDPTEVIDAPKKRGRPKGSTLTTGVKPAKRGRGRPKGSKSKTKPAAPTPKKVAKRKTIEQKVPVNIQPDRVRWQTFMGNATDPKILAQLMRISPTNRNKFIAQAKKQLPAMYLTPWTPSEQSNFAKWYFMNRHA